jgi:hypothetical protein
MKGIIVALESKRAGPRAGGGEKRMAAQHVVKLILSAVALCACSEPAPAAPERSTPVAAASNGVWTDPTGRISVDFAAHGWTPLVDTPVRPGVLAQVEHVAYQNASHQARMCHVSEERAPTLSRMTQEQINQHVQSQPLEGLAGAMPGDVSEQGYMSVNGMTVVAFRLDQPMMRLYFRIFFLPTETGVTQVSLVCGGSPPLNDEETANMIAVLNTLRIARET